MKTSGFGDTFIDEMVMGALRTNYGQNTEIPGFVGELQKRKKKKSVQYLFFLMKPLENQSIEVVKEGL